MGILKKYVILICLTAQPEIIYERVKSKKNRPLLETADPLHTVKALLAERTPTYQEADRMIDTSNLTMDEVVDKVIQSFHELVKKRGNTRDE